MTSKLVIILRESGQLTLNIDNLDFAVFTASIRSMQGICLPFLYIPLDRIKVILVEGAGADVVDIQGMTRQ